MNECISVKHDFHKTPNKYPNLNANISNEQQLRLDKISEMKDYFLAEIRERKLISKNISKYIASLDYFEIKCFIHIISQHFYCIICNCYWGTCRNNWSKLLS